MCEAAQLSRQDHEVPARVGVLVSSASKVFSRVFLREAEESVQSKRSFPAVIMIRAELPSHAARTMELSARRRPAGCSQGISPFVTPACSCTSGRQHLTARGRAGLVMEELQGGGGSCHHPQVQSGAHWNGMSLEKVLGSLAPCVRRPCQFLGACAFLLSHGIGAASKKKSNAE